MVCQSITEITVRNVTVKLLTEADRVAAHYRSDGSFEPRSMALWVKLCEPGAVMIDCGSYTGLYTIAARLLGCHCIAFEPLPANAARLRQNAELNGVSKDVCQAAAGEGMRRAEFFYNDGPRLTSGGSLRGNSTRNRRTEVDMTTLDHFALQHVAAIKIDVEGSETEVLRGMRKTLMRCGPELIVEALTGAALKSVMHVVSEFGYTKVRTLDRRNAHLSRT
jgi:FkbM family methyltransferase